VDLSLLRYLNKQGLGLLWYQYFEVLERLQKSGWWKGTARSFWLLFVVLPYFVIAILLGVLVVIGLLDMQHFLGYAVITLFFIAFAYYGRTIPSLGLRRVIWIVLVGVGLIGFPIFVVSGLLFAKVLTSIIGSFLSLIVIYSTSMIVGMLIADRIGKKTKLQTTRISKNFVR